jgi:predicted ester cyclase
MRVEDKNKRLVAAYVAAFNNRNYEKLRTLFARNAIVYGVLGKGGLEVVIPIWRELHDGLGTQLHVDEIIAEGDTVAVRYTERGKFIGPFRGHAPTGQTYEIAAMEWFIVHGGKIVQRWGARDAMTIARQVGIPLN